MYDIHIANSQDDIPVNEAFLREVVQRTLEVEEVRAAEISVAVMGNEEIHALNRQYLDHDYATDVLSFLLECDDPDVVATPNGSPLGQGKTISGEVIVSAEMAADRAAEFGWETGDELLLYLVHGLLHLCGYEDHSDAERALMRSRERDVLALWDVVPRESEQLSGNDH